MKIYNTMSKRKEEFVPLEEGKVKMYVCGPTVYNYIHIGNARPMIVFDTVRRYFEYKNYDVNYVSNFTDVDDKIIKKANEEGVTAEEISQRYIAECKKDMDGMNIEPATKNPLATEEIDGMISMIETLIEKGYAYEKNGTVYYRTRKFKDYGKLSHKNLDDLQSGGRTLLVSGEDEKEDSLDFVLWKPKKEGEPAWVSPWGEGRPGWHIECSEMSKKYLGEQIDIHAGGEDLIFPHHENEIAQSKGCTGKIPAKFWMHCDFLLIDGGKMSKSLGNTYLVQDLIDRGYDPLSYKMLCFTAHYRNKLNFTWEGLANSQNSLIKLKEGYVKHKEGTEDVDESLIQEYKTRFLEALNDDLNMPVAMSVVWDVVKNPVKSKKLADLLLDFDKILGIKIEEPVQVKREEIPEDVQKLLEQRNLARQEKNWALSDELRDKIKVYGYTVKDSKDGTTLEKI